MTRLVVAASALGLLLAVTVATNPVGAGSGPGTQVNIVKVVEGQAPDGTEFAVALDCDVDNDDELLMFGASGGTQSTNTGTFNQSCTVAETDDGGADSVSYACAVNDPGGGLAPPVPTSCTTDTSFVTGLNGEITFTVTNTFVDDEVPEDTLPDEDDQDGDAAPAGVVSATPSFTG